MTSVRIPPNHQIPNDLKFSDEHIHEAALKYGTPLYIYDCFNMQSSWRSLESVLPQQVNIYYSVKANPNLAIIDYFKGLGANFETASVGEFMAVLKAGVSPSKIIFVGPGKTRLEIVRAIENGIDIIVAESAQEVSELQAISSEIGKHTKVALRINPGIGNGMLTMGGVTQFGMDQDTALMLLTQDQLFPNLQLVGIQGYLGTRILDWTVIRNHTKLLLEISDELQQKSGREFTFVDIGGGFGIPYYDKENSLDLALLGDALNILISSYTEKHPQTVSIAVESGRYLVGRSGIFVTRVLDVKNVQNHCWVILDGGTNVFGGHDMYVGARPLPIRVLGHKGSEGECSLCGPLCTPMDRLAANVQIKIPEKGDLIVFYLAGAYAYTGSPGLFLSHGFPAEVLFRDGIHLLVRERITPEQIISGQTIPHMKTTNWET